MFKKLFAITIAVLALAGIAQAQALGSLTYTTTAAAIDASARTFTVASNSGFAPANTIANPLAGNLFNQLALIDHEVIEIRSVTGSTIVTGIRGAFGTQATAHASGSAVLVGPAQAFSANTPEGKCTASTE